MAEFYSVLTKYGEQAIANAIANKTPLKITQIGVGDGNGESTTPTREAIALKNEKRRANANARIFEASKNQIVVEQVIPADVGGFYIREIGIYDNNNKLIAIGNYPETYKAVITSGAGQSLLIRVILKVSSLNSINLTIDNSTLYVTQSQLQPKTIGKNTTNNIDELGHSHEINEATTEQSGIVQLVDNVTTDDNTKALTARQGSSLKRLIDSLTRNLSNYITNSKKSDSVTSPSSDTVATSKAAKTAYDRGTEGINAANKVGSRVTTLENETWKFDQKTLSDGTDLNEIRQPGFYRKPANAYTLRNEPTSLAFDMQVMSIQGNNESYVKQLVFEYNSNKVFSRFIRDGIIGEWTRTDGIDANSKVDKSGDTMTGVLNINTGSSWEKIRATLNDGGFWRWEVHPVSSDDTRFNFVYRFPNGNQRYMSFPALNKNETIAYQSWVSENYINNKNTSDSTTSNSSGTIATSKAVKTAYDRGTEGVTEAGKKVNKAGDAMTGELSLPSLTTETEWLDLKGKRGNSQAVRIYSGTGQRLYFGTDKQNVFEKDIVFSNSMMLADAGVNWSGDPSSSNNCDGLWHDDGSNTWYFQSDKPYKSKSNLNSKIKAGEFISEGNITTENGYIDITTNTWTNLRARKGANGEYWQWESNPNGTPDMKFYHDNGSGVRGYINFPNPRNSTTSATVNSAEYVAYQSWVTDGFVNKRTIDISNMNERDRVNALNQNFGSYRPNGETVNGERLGSLYMHIPHSSFANNQYARGISFEYGTSWKLYTHRWDENGRHIGRREILTENDFTYQKIGDFEITKYPTGMMMQSFVINQYDLKDWYEKSFKWAVAFRDVPLILSKVTTSTNNSHNAGVNILTKSNETTCYYIEYEHGAIIQGDVRIQFFAVGRWK